MVLDGVEMAEVRETAADLARVVRARQPRHIQVCHELMRRDPDSIEKVRFFSPSQGRLRYGEDGRFGVLMIETSGGAG